MEATVAQQPTTGVRMSPPQMATRGSRFLAALIDSAVFVGIYLVAILFNSPELLILGIALFAIYQIYLLTSLGQTVGKKVMSIKIVTFTGNANGGFMTNVLMRSILNSLISFVPFYSLVDVLFIFRDDQRCIHDLIAGTKVVKA